MKASLTADGTLNNHLRGESMKNIDLGKQFKAVTGSFDPSFVSYLSQLDDVEYVETNQIYKAAILPTSSKPQPYTPQQTQNQSKQQKEQQRRSQQKHQKRNLVTQLDVPSWGIARINRRDRRNLNSYSADEYAG
jgi:hypothetical protein